MMSASKLVLIVDDDEDIRDAIRQALEDEGYEVADAANGREALELLQTGPIPALILLDLMMPVMTGEQFLLEQRQRPALAQIPVVVLSANDRIKEKAELFHAAGYLRKPVTLDVLLGVARQFAG
jgi:CheY-like chemotaxis protein